MGELYIHHDPKLTAEQEENLIRLARHLVIFSQTDGWVAENFQMGAAVRSLVTGDELAPHHVASHNGPILSDPLGFGPLAGIAPRAGEDWLAYQTRVLGAPFDSPLESWLLSYWWCHTDNTPIGAAMRMMYALDFGVPHDYALIIEGRVEPDYLRNGFLWDRAGLVPPYPL
jgi:hypothetical protein